MRCHISSPKLKELLLVPSTTWNQCQRLSLIQSQLNTLLRRGRGDGTVICGKIRIFSCEPGVAELALDVPDLSPALFIVLSY